MSDKTKIFAPLIGQTIIKLERLIVLENKAPMNDSEALSDNLVFTLSNGCCSEVFVTSENAILKKIINKQDFLISFALEKVLTIRPKQAIFIYFV